MAIKSCTCEHKYQDEKHGKGKRVHNPGKGQNGSTEWVCTVCGNRK